MRSIRELLEEIDGGLDRVASGELVVLYEAEFNEADGIVNAENYLGGKRAMLVRQIEDLDFTPNPEWVCFCMTAKLWASARGRDTIMWTSTFGEKDNG